MAQRGQDYILQAKAPGGGSYTNVGKLTSVSLSRERETTETNNFDSPDWAESISTMRNWSISAEALYVYDDAGQAIIEAAFAANSAYEFLLTSVDGTAGVFEYEGEGFVTSLEMEFETNEVVSYSIDIEGTGILTRTAIAGT